MKIILSILLLIFLTLETLAQPAAPGPVRSEGGTFIGGTITSPMLAPDGTASLPGYSFASDPDSGFFLSSAANLRLALGGTTAGIFDVTNWSGTVARTFLLRHVNSSAGAPTYSFIADSNTGMYSDTPDMLQFATGGTKKLELSTVIRIIDSGAKPTCDATIRGGLWYEAGGAGVADTLEACGKSTGDTYSWQAVATF